MLKKYYVLIVSLAAGLLGLWQRGRMAASYDALALPIPSTNTVLGMLAISLLLLALLTALSLSQRKTNATQRLPAQTKSGSTAFLPLLLGAAAGAVTLFAAYRFYTQTAAELATLRLNAQLSGQAYRPDILVYLFVVLLVFAAAAILLASFKRASTHQPLHDSTTLLLPGFACCIWLMISYRHFAGDPFLGNYVFQLLAMLSGMLTHYFIAANSFQGDARPRISLAGGLAIYFSMLSMRFNPSSPDGLLCLAQILYFTSVLLLIAKADASTQPIPAQENATPVHMSKEEAPE